MIGVQMPLPLIVSVAKLGKHSISRRFAKLEPAAVRYNIRLPPAIHTTPAVALEAHDAQPAVIHIVSALGAVSPGLIDRPSCCCVMFRTTRRPADQPCAARMRAGVLEC